MIRAKALGSCGSFFHQMKTKRIRVKARVSHNLQCLHCLQLHRAGYMVWKLTLRILGWFGLNFFSNISWCLSFRFLQHCLCSSSEQALKIPFCSLQDIFLTSTLSLGFYLLLNLKRCSHVLCVWWCVPGAVTDGRREEKTTGPLRILLKLMLKNPSCSQRSQRRLSEKFPLLIRFLH